MSNFLLSYFSPETLSWTGFIVLGVALVGEAGAALIAILSKGETLHKELAFVLAIAAAAGYAVEKVGDDAILHALTERANTAEIALAKVKAARTLTPERQEFVAGAVKQFKGQRYEVAISDAADDGIEFWYSLHATLEKAGWTYLAPPEGQPAKGQPAAYIPIASMPGVEIRLDPANEAAVAPAALALGNALHADGMVVAVNRNTQSNPDQKHRDVLLVVIGARVPPR